MSKLVHAMIRVLDETRSRAYYAEAFGLEVSDRFDFPDFTLIYMRAPG
ncbi:VOC family protein, partial [Serratia marcescens]